MTAIREGFITARADASLLLRLMARDLPAFRMAILLVGTVLLLLCVHVAAFAGTTIYPGSGLMENLYASFNIIRDESVPSFLMHGLAFLAAAMFLLTFVTHFRHVLLFLSAVFAFIWLDDSAQYHERVGAVLAEMLNLPQVFGLRSIDLGELLAWGIAGAALLPVAIWAAWKSRDGDWGIALLGGTSLFLLAFCGLVVDMLHVVTPLRYESLVAFVEDGGEMLAVALAPVLAIGVSRVGGTYFERCSSAARRSSAKAQVQQARVASGLREHKLTKSL